MLKRYAKDNRSQLKRGRLLSPAESPRPFVHDALREVPVRIHLATIQQILNPVLHRPAHPAVHLRDALETTMRTTGTRQPG